MYTGPPFFLLVTLQMTLHFCVLEKNAESCIKSTKEEKKREE